MTSESKTAKGSHEVYENSALARLREANAKYVGMELNRVAVLRNLVAASIQRASECGPSCVLDIGCGHGFCSDAKTQKEIAELANVAVGVEPDTTIASPEYFDQVWRQTFEDAPILPDSVDVAYSCFVLEHLAQPEPFWRKLRDCLKPRGEFWGFTVDARHPFSMCSRAMELTSVKDWYLSWLYGQRGQDRYENYPVWYRCNSPRAIRRLAKGFSALECLSMHRPGQLDFYIPHRLRPLSRILERCLIAAGFPGSLLIIWARK